jgi:hypothetical protein
MKERVFSEIYPVKMDYFINQNVNFSGNTVLNQENAVT